MNYVVSSPSLFLCFSSSYNPSLPPSLSLSPSLFLPLTHTHTLSPSLSIALPPSLPPFLSSPLSLPFFEVDRDKTLLIDIPGNGGYDVYCVMARALNCCSITLCNVFIIWPTVCIILCVFMCTTTYVHVYTYSDSFHFTFDLTKTSLSPCRQMLPN